MNNNDNCFAGPCENKVVYMTAWVAYVGQGQK